MSTDNAIEQEIQSKGLTAPRVTPADLEAAISGEFYFTAHEGLNGAMAMLSNPDDDVEFAQVSVRHDDAPAVQHLTLLTFCVLVLKNGFTVVGKSACASPDNFDAALGRKIARQDAVAQMWPLLGYALKERLANAA